jgi:RHS repeat-associated protein
MIADQSATPVWRWDQGEPFGSDVPNNNPSGAGAFVFNLRFPGQYFDRETNLAYNVMRDYDPLIGRYVESDPIGIKGGMNTYAYVRSNPLGLRDPLGLVEWKGTFGGASYIEGAGAGVYFFSLESECKCHRIVKMSGVVITVAAGLGGKAYSGSVGGSDFHDYLDCPDADVANGWAAMLSAGAVFGGGAGCSRITLGHLYSNWSCGGPLYGFDFSIGAYFGASLVTNRSQKCC